MTPLKTSKVHSAITVALPLAALLACSSLVALARLSPSFYANRHFAIDSVVLGTWVLIATTIPLVRSLGVRRMPALPFELPAAVFLGLAALSVAVSGRPWQSLNQWLRYAGFVALAIAVAVVALDTSRRRFAYWSLVAVGSMTAVIAVAQYILPTRQAEQFSMSGVTSVRVFATFANPDFFGEFLVIVVCVALLLCFLETGFGRAVAVTAAVLLGAGLVLTFTRGSWIGLVIGILVVAGLAESRVVWVVAGGAAVLLGLIPGAAQRLEAIVSVSDQPRLGLWQAAWRIIVAHPLLGVGLGLYVYAIRDLYHDSLAIRRLAGTPGSAHDSYLLLAAETGILGGLAFVWMIIEPVRTGIALAARAPRHGRQLIEVAFLTAAIVAFSVNALTSNSFQHPQVAFFFWIVVGLQAGLGATLWGEDPAAATTPHGPKAVSAMRSAWAVSAPRRALVSPPVRGGRLLWDSRLGGWLAGAGAVEPSTRE